MQFKGSIKIYHFRWYMGAADPNQDPGTSPPGHPGVILSEDDGANGAVAANSDAATV